MSDRSIFDVLNYCNEINKETDEKLESILNIFFEMDNYIGEEEKINQLYLPSPRNNIWIGEAKKRMLEILNDLS